MSSYSNLVGTFTERLPGGGAPIPQVRQFVPVLIGQTGLRKVMVENELVVRTPLGSDEEPIWNDALSNIVANILSVSDLQDGIGAYRDGVDFEVNNGEILWKQNKCATPVLLPGTLGVGGSMTGTKTYKIVALKKTSEDQELVTDYSTTEASNEVTVVFNSTQKKVTLRWAAVEHCDGYRVYQGTSGTYNFLVDLGKTITSYVIDGTVSEGEVVVPPTENEAYLAPYTNQPYYASYDYTEASVYTWNEFTKIEDLFLMHGMSSELGIFGKLALDPVGGNAARRVACVAVEDLTGMSDAQKVACYQLALAVVKTKYPLLIVIPYLVNEDLDAIGLAFATWQSSFEERRETFWWTGHAAGSLVGDETISGSLCYQSKALGSDRVCFFEAKTLKANVFVDEDGTIEEQELPRTALAAAAAGYISFMDDPAESLTYKTMNGFSTIESWDRDDIKRLTSCGGTVYGFIDGKNRFYHSVTTDTSTLQVNETNVQLAEAAMRVGLRNLVNDLIGRKNQKWLIEATGYRTQSYLDYLVAIGLLTSYSNLTVRQWEHNPLYVWVQFEYQPMWSANAFIFAYQWMAF